MNKTKIEWCDYTWNPVTGCLHGCSYCYAKKQVENPFYSRAFPYGFKPHFYKKRLNEPQKIKIPSSIFVVSMGDLFGDWVKFEWIDCVFQACAEATQHTYIFLTKNPRGIPKEYIIEDNDGYVSRDPIVYPNNWWFGISCSSTDDQWRVDELKKISSDNLFVSFEPLLGPMTELDLTGIKQVIIGAQTNPLITPPDGAIRSIVVPAAYLDIPRFFKESISGVAWEGQSTYINNHELAWRLNK